MSAGIICSAHESPDANTNEAIRRGWRETSTAREQPVVLIGVTVLFGDPGATGFAPGGGLSWILR